MINYLVDIVSPDNTTPNPNNCYVSPSVYYGNNNNCSCKPPVCYECNDQFSCINQMIQDFSRLKNLGYNGVKIPGMSIHYNACSTTSNFCSSLVTNPNPLSKCFSISVSRYDACCPQVNLFFSNVLDIANFMIPKYLAVLNAAQQTGMKVIFNMADMDIGIVSGSFITPLDMVAVNEYAQYLAIVSSALKNETALLGYDLINEPSNLFNGHPVDGGSFYKKSICDATSIWYNAIKTNDPNHLVTIGLQDVSMDIWEWDYGNVAVDFHSFHIYPSIKDPNINSEKQKGKEYAYSMIEWIGKNVHQPWMFGETGFSSMLPPLTPLSDCTIDNKHKSVDGDYNEQLSYFQEVYQKVRDWGGMGIAFWQYKDVYWSPSNDGGQTFPLCYHDGMGILDRNDNLKPAAYTFQNYSYNQQSPYFSNNYYDVLGLTAPTSNNCISGYIYYGNAPVQDASIFSWTYKKLPNNVEIWSPVPNASSGCFSPDISGSSQVFTKSDGSFYICNGLPNSHSFTNSPCISNNYNTFLLRISHLGHNVIWDVVSTDDSNSNGLIYYLDKAQNFKDVNINNISIGIGQTYNSNPLVSYNNIYAQNVVVDGNGTNGGYLDLRSAGKINLKELKVKRGGTFHAGYGIPAQNCNDPVNTSVIILGKLNPHSTVISEEIHGHQQLLSSSTKVKSILLQTIQESESVSYNEKFIPYYYISVFPNPSEKGIFHIYVSDIDEQSTISLIDACGKILISRKMTENYTILNIQDYDKGIYFLKISNSKYTDTKKIIY
ncbi:MAG: hypothetical protein OHK0036_15170 [Bacteroidia bacterium]